MTAGDSLRFHPEVASDLRTASGWYTDISPDLANRLRVIIDTSFDAIADHPALYPLLFDDVRFVRMRTFPYLVLYRVVNDTPYILGVFHGASDPAKWRRRAST